MTLVLLDVIVNLHMRDIMRYVLERGTTLVALSDLLSRVDTPMLRHSTTRFERLPTGVTLVRSLTSVHSVVISQGIKRDERLSTDITSVRPFSCMRSAVI